MLDSGIGMACASFCGRSGICSPCGIWGGAGTLVEGGVGWVTRRTCSLQHSSLCAVYDLDLSLPLLRAPVRKERAPVATLGGGSGGGCFPSTHGAM